MSVKIAIVEDNAGVRENWVKLLNSEPGFKCVGACESGEAALERFPRLKPDVVLMDINLPGMSGIECTARIKQELPGTQILMVTVYADNEYVFEALKVGASGYLLKCADLSELTRSIRDVVSGGAPMSGQIARRVIEVFRGPAKPARTPTPAAALTPREEEILGLVAKGYANKEVATRLKCSIETIRVHVRHIYEKLHVHSRTEAAARYLSGAKPQRLQRT
jgi:DNA-binding NarL/FixJ family response regulator